VIFVRNLEAEEEKVLEMVSSSTIPLSHLITPPPSPETSVRSHSNKSPTNKAQHLHDTEKRMKNLEALQKIL